MTISWSRAQIAYFAGLITSVCTALYGQGEMIGEPYRHWLAIGGIVGTAVSGYLLQPPRGDAQTRVSDPPPEPPKVTL